MNERQHTVAFLVARMKERILDLHQNDEIGSVASLDELSRQTDIWHLALADGEAAHRSEIESAHILIDEWLQAGRPLTHNWLEPSSRWAGTGATVEVQVIRKTPKHWLTGEYEVIARIVETHTIAPIGYVWGDRYGWNARTEHRVIGTSVANRLKTRKAAVELLIAHVGDTTAPAASV